MARFSDWIDQRLGHRRILRAALDEPVPGGARWAYVFGSGLAVIFASQLVTGLALAAYYSASTRDAWASVDFIEHRVFLGWLLRGLHHHGASAMIVVMALHLLQTAWFGAFRAPRELNWIVGVLLMLLVLGFALTGYLLPWDQKGYWATQVATSIAGTVPLVGRGLQTFVQGGSGYGNLTLTRFFSFHVLLLPAAAIGALLLHLYLFRRHGVTPPPSMSEEQARAKTELFYPAQLFRDALFAFAVLAAVLVVTWINHGADLRAPADPSSQYLARPEWYFLPLFQLLKYFEGPLAVLGTVVLPSLAIGGLAAIPFLHPWLSRRSPNAHGALATAISGGLAVAITLGVQAVMADRSNPALRELAERDDRDAAQAARLAELGVPASGPLDLYLNDPVVYGERVFRRQCETCHHPCSNKPYKGDPCLQGYASRAWLGRLLRQPQSAYFFGNDRIDEMDPYSGDAASLSAIVEFLYSQGARPDVDATLAARGAKLFDSEGCGACHSLDGSGGDAPDLKGYAAEAWLTAFVRHPGDARFYSKKNFMKVFTEQELSDDELRAVVAYLRSRVAEPVNFP